MAPTKVDNAQVHGDTATKKATTCTDIPVDETSASASFTSQPKNETSDQRPHHVIFVVHGMGRQLEEYGNYERNVGYLVENTKTVLQSTFHELQTDVHIIPIEWHAKLHSLVDERMSLTSLKTVPKVRMVMNDYLADILYYFNGHFGSVMIKMIVDELNEAYETFMAKHPDFNGKISVFALSLGGVAMFDILTCLDDEDEDMEQSKVNVNADKDAKTQEEEQPKKLDEEAKSTKRNKGAKIKKQDQPKFRAVVPKLKFRPQYLFTVGSPVGAVMVMRNLDWESFHPPDDIIHHNLFHPFDPLGYRIEPLIDPVFAGIPAVLLSTYSSSQALFSLPSLPSLLPGSLSSFWENKVPALPRPSIPTLSSLSQMTQSLKAGRWLSGNGNASGSAHANESGASTPTTRGEDEESNGATTSSPSSSTTSTDSEARKEQQQQGEAMIIDADASATEYMAAATVATCLEPKEASSSTAGASNAIIDTTTGSSPKPPTFRRRPSLGPRRVSSRVEDEQDSINAALEQQQQQKKHEQGKLADLTEEEAGLTQASHGSENRDGADVSSAPSPLDLEYFLGMETGATAQEKAQGLGAKSDVVQESMVRSLPPSPGVREEQEQEQRGAKAESQIKAKAAEASESRHVADERDMEGKKNRTVHVEGRATKVPYRIDHVLQETAMDQYTNEYLLGMRSHFRYWGNRDVAYHILRTMLQPGNVPSSGGDDTILDLKLTMPVPVTTAKGAKEAAEAIAKANAKATARSRNGSMGKASSGSAAEQETKKQNRKSFSFSFFGGYDYAASEDERERVGAQEQRRRQQQEEADEDLAMMDEEGELFGYRSSDLDMSNDNNHGASTTSTSTSKVTPRRPTLSSQASSFFVADAADATERTRGSKRRISMYGKDKAFSDPAEDADTAASMRGASSPSVEEGWVPAPVPVLVPELARPAKLHHRSSRVEEKQ